MEDKKYFDYSGVQVTSTRLIAPKETFAMAGINSVKIKKVNAAPYFAFSFIVLGLMALAGSANIWIVAPFLVVGVLLCFVKPSYHVVIGCNGRDQRALNSKDKKFIETVVAAVDKAMAARG